MMIKFKPCPFCGSENIGVRDVVVDRIMGNNCPSSCIRTIWAYCRDCGCEGRKRTGDLVYDSEIIALAAESWNDRYPVKNLLNSMYADSDSIKVREDKNE